MPSDSKTTDPRPAATETALVPYEALSVWDQSNYRNLRTVGVTHDEALRLANEWMRMRDGALDGTAAAPPSGQVCVSRETAMSIWQRLPERTLTITTGSAPDLVEFARAIQHALEGDQS